MVTFNAASDCLSHGRTVWVGPIYVIAWVAEPDPNHGSTCGSLFKGLVNAPGGDERDSRGQKMLQGETMSIMFVDGAKALSSNIMDMVSPYAPGFALWNKLRPATLKSSLSSADIAAENSQFADTRHFDKMSAGGRMGIGVCVIALRIIPGHTALPRDAANYAGSTSLYR